MSLPERTGAHETQSLVVAGCRAVEGLLDHNRVDQAQGDEPGPTEVVRPSDLYIHTRLCIVMATKTISLDEEAYERLKAHKREGESFSDVVKRLSGERSWTEVTGILSDAEADSLETAIEAGRDRSRERRERLRADLRNDG